MKMKFRGTTLAALLLSASASAYADTNSYVTDGTSKAFVGDMDVTDSNVAPVSPVNYAPVTVGDLQPHVDPAMSNYQQASFLGDGCSSSSCDTACDAGCDSGCDSMGCGSKKGFGLNLCSKDGWFRAEAMLMWMQTRYAPPLVSSSPEGTLPILGANPDAVVEFGEDLDGGGLDGGLSGGLRIDGGHYFENGIGIGGRVTWLSDNGDSFSMSGNGNGRSIGRPYIFIPTLNAGLGGPDAELINFDGGGPLQSISGDINIDFDTEVFGAEAYGRLRLCNSDRCRVEFLGGYSYWGIDDEVRIRSRSLVQNTAVETVFNESWDTENRFNGGQLGFESVVNRGRWSARLLSKVHLGNMERSVRISGTTDERTLGGAVQPTSNSSLLVENIQGENSDDVFAFIPEVNATLGYRFRDHVTFTVGYNFTYFDNVALAGDHINVLHDTDDLGDPIPAADIIAPSVLDGSLWIQGITLGASIDY